MIYYTENREVYFFGPYYFHECSFNVAMKGDRTFFRWFAELLRISEKGIPKIPNY
jgi:hypothetical protein